MTIFYPYTFRNIFEVDLKFCAFLANFVQLGNVSTRSANKGVHMLPRQTTAPSFSIHLDKGTQCSSGFQS